MGQKNVGLFGVVANKSYFCGKLLTVRSKAAQPCRLTTKHLIIMKTLITLAALLLNVSFAMADVYSEGLKKMMNAGALSLNLEKLRSTFPDNGQASAGLDRLDDMVEIIAPYYRKNMSETEFTQMVDYQLQPEILAIQKSMLGNVNDIGAMMQGMMDKVMTIAQGGNAEPIAEKDASPVLKEKIHRYFEMMDVKNTVTSSMKSVKQVVLSQAAGNPQNEQMITVFDRITNYMENNVSALLANIFVEKVSEESLDACLKMSDQPFFPAMKRANKAMLDDMPAIIEKIIPRMK